MSIDLLQEYKELYYKEIEFREVANAKIGTSITLLTAICSGHIFMWNIMDKLQTVIHLVPIIFLLLEILSVFFTLLAMFCFCKTYYGYEYFYISIEDFKQSIGDNNKLIFYYPIEEIDKANYEMLCNTFLEYASKNRNCNLQKNKWQSNMTRYIILSLLLLICVYIIWFFIIRKFTF